MTLTIKLFGVLKTLTGLDGEWVCTVDEGSTVQDLVESIHQVYPQVGALLLGKKILVSVNHEIVHWDTVISMADDIALLPPFAGGSEGLG